MKLSPTNMASPAARIRDLDAMGCVIASDRTVAADSDGFSHYGVVVYTLLAEPELLEVGE